MVRSKTKNRVIGITLWTAGCIVVLLLLVQLVGSPIATKIVNQRLENLPGYPGRVRSIQLEVWRAKVVAKDFVLVQQGHEADGPVVNVGSASFAFAPVKLLAGRVSGRFLIEDVNAQMIQEPPKGDRKSEDKTEKKEAHEQGGRAWQELLQKNFPVDVTRLEVKNLKVKFVDHSRALPSQVLLEKIHLVAHDFKTQPQQAGDLPAKIKMDGSFPGGGTLAVDAAGDSTAANPAFHATLEIKNLALVPLHDFLQSYALVDVRKGSFDLYVEVNAQGGHYDGYTKPFFRDLEFKSVSDPDKNFIQNAAAKVASATQNLLKSSDDAKIATKAPFQGNFADNQIDLWQTIENLLRNAFIAGLREGFEGQKPNA